MIRPISSILATTLLSLSLLTSAPVLAGSGSSCSCSKKCSTACENGKGENCQCKDCGCYKGSCKHGKCHHHKEPAKGADLQTDPATE